MRLRTVVAFALGFYVGAWAGRSRFHQINRAAADLAASTIGKKARAVGDLTVERARSALHLPADSAQPTEPIETIRATPPRGTP